MQSWNFASHMSFPLIRVPTNIIQILWSNVSYTEIVTN